MRYSFICDECELSTEVNASIQDGPPKKVECPECGENMYQEFGGNFILKGDFPGKKLTRQKEGTATADSADEFHDAVDRIEQNQREVLNERRKGTESFREYEKRNPKKVRDYHENARVYGLGNKDTRSKAKEE